MLPSARRVQDNQAWSMTMTPEAPESPLTERVRSLEARWFFPGQLETAAARWFGRFSPLRQDSDDLAGWRPVRKKRRITRFSLASGPIVARGPGTGQQPRCEVELTEVRMRGQDWWTLGFEVTGPADLLRGALQATAALVFAQALPGSMEPGPDESRSYAEWLCQQSGAESYAAWKASDDRILMPADQR